MTAIPKFIFMFYRYMGFKCNSFDAFNEKSHFLSAIFSDGQKLTKKLPTNSLTNFFSYSNGLT